MHLLRKGGGDLAEAAPRVGGARGRQADVDAHVAGERHLERGGQQTAVRHVVPREQHPLADEGLRRTERAAQQRRIVHVGHYVPDLAVAVRDT